MPSRTAALISAFVIKRVKGVPVAANGHLIVNVVGLPEILELPKVVVALDVAFHLKVRFGTDVVVRGDLDRILSMSRRQGQDRDPCYQQD